MKTQQDRVPLLDQELKTIARGAGTYFIGKTIGTGIKYLTQVALARLLGPALLGIYSLGIVLHEITALFSRIGLLHGGLRYVSIFHGTKETKKLKGMLITIITLPLTIGIVSGASLYLGAHFLSETVFGKPELFPVLRIFAIAVPFWAGLTVAARATTGFQTTKFIVLIREYIQPLFNFFLIIILGLFGFGLFGSVFAWVISAVAGFAAAVHFIQKLFPPLFQRKTIALFESKKLIGFSLPLIFSELTDFILGRTDIVMLGYFLPISEVGIFRAVSQSSLIVILFLISFIQIFTPMMADLINRKQYDKLRLLFKDIARWNFSLTLPFVLIVVVAGRDILHLFGQEFQAGWSAYIILSLGHLAHAASSGISLMLVMSGRQYQKVLGDFLIISSNILLNLIFIPKWGILGAAAATAISLSVVSILMIVLVYRSLRVHPFSWGYLKAVGAGIAALGAGTAVYYWSPSSFYILNLLLKAFSVIFTYSAVLWLMKFEDSDKYIFYKIIGKLKK